MLALHEQVQCHLQNSSKGVHRQKLLKQCIVKNNTTGTDAINIDRFPVNKTITKIVKSIYWLHTNGDIIQRYNPGWWIMPGIDASKKIFIENHLKTTNADIYWDNKFITHYSVGLPENGVGGLISCSLHFYSNKSVNKGMSWYLIASPVNTEINGKSLFDMCAQKIGDPTIAPQNK